MMDPVADADFERTVEGQALLNMDAHARHQADLGEVVQDGAVAVG